MYSQTPASSHNSSSAMRPHSSSASFDSTPQHMQQHQQQFNSYAPISMEYSSPQSHSRTMQQSDGGGSGGSGMHARGLSGGGGGGGSNSNNYSSSYAPTPSSSGTVYSKQSAAPMMMARAPNGGASYNQLASSSNANANGNSSSSSRDLTPISHPSMMQRSSQPASSSQQQQQAPLPSSQRSAHSYSSSSPSSQSYQAPPSSYSSNIGPIGSLGPPLSSRDSMMMDPFDSNSGGGGMSPIGSLSSQMQYSPSAGSAQVLMPLPPHPNAVPPAAKGGKKSTSSNSQLPSSSTIAAGSGSNPLQSPLDADSSESSKPIPLPPPPPRVDLTIRKQTLDTLLGDNESRNQYWNLIEKYLMVKLTKGELDAFVLEKLGRRNIHVHNDFFLAVLQNACSDELPPKPARKKGERKPRSSVKAEGGGKAASAKKNADGTAAAGAGGVKKERKARRSVSGTSLPTSGKKGKDGAPSSSSSGKKSKRKSRASTDHDLTSVGNYLASSHWHAHASHKPMAHITRPSQYFATLENQRNAAYATGGASIAYGAGGHADAGDLSGAGVLSSAVRASLPNSIPPPEGHLQPPRPVVSTAHSVTIEHAQQLLQSLFKPRAATTTTTATRPTTSQLALPRAKSVSPRSNAMDDSASSSEPVSASAFAASSSLPTSVSSSALSTVMMHSASSSSASPSRLMRNELPPSYSSVYSVHAAAESMQQRRSFQTMVRQLGGGGDGAADDRMMDDTGDADGDGDLDDDDDVDDVAEFEESFDPYARLGDSETRSYLSSLYSHPVPDRDSVRKRLYHSALQSGVPNVSEAAVTMMQQATEEHLKSIIASILEFARPDKRGSLVRVLQATLPPPPATQDAVASAEIAASSASTSSAAASSSSVPASSSSTMDESSNGMVAAGAAVVPVPATTPAAAAASVAPANGSLPQVHPLLQHQDTGASVDSAVSLSSGAAGAAMASPSAAAAASSASDVSMLPANEPMSASQRIAFVRAALSGPHADPALLPPLAQSNWHSSNAEMPVTRSDSPLPSLRVDSPNMRIPLNAHQLSAALRLYPELLSPSTAPLLLERLNVV